MNAAPIVDVSVVMPTWNRADFLTATIDSVFGQTVAIKELIIADDGSDATTRAVLEKYAAMPRIRVLFGSHCGNPGKVRNTAIREASARYIAFADSDDVWCAGKLERQLAALQAQPGCRWSFTSWSCIDAQGRPIPTLGEPERQVRSGTLVESLARFHTRVPLPSVLAERTLLFDAGLFDEGMGCYGDYDLWVRMAAVSEAACVSESLVKVRLHDQHFSRGDSRASLAGRERFLGRALKLVHTPSVRAQMQRMRALNSAQLANLASLDGDDDEALGRLRDSLGNGWSMPRWWLNAARAQSRLLTRHARRMLARRW